MNSFVQRSSKCLMLEVLGRSCGHEWWRWRGILRPQFIGEFLLHMMPVVSIASRDNHFFFSSFLFMLLLGYNRKLRFFGWRRPELSLLGWYGMLRLSFRYRRKMWRRRWGFISS